MTLPINQILQGDSLTRLKDIDSDSIDCIVTSPPYWNLRNYKVEGQLGIEKNFNEYLDRLVEIFVECKRVLKKEGSCWVVLGDTFSGGGNPRNGLSTGIVSKRVATNKVYGIEDIKTEYKEKSLIMIPERFAIKMIDNGWILRNKIIWNKPNAMPSSAKDRFTIDYENIYFFTKSQKYYFRTQYEPLISRRHAPLNKSHIPYANGEPQQGFIRNKEKVWGSPEGKIKRCIWTITTQPFPESHFAVFPEELVRQCLDAGCPQNGIVLDCFMGSGTTALVSLKKNRRFVGIELNPDYIKIAQKRIEPYLFQSKVLDFVEA